MTDKIAAIRDVLPVDETKSPLSHLDVTMAAYLAFVHSLSCPSTEQPSKAGQQDHNANLSKWVR